MAASRPVQASAPGLLSLLGLKNMGELPADFPDSVQSTLELLQFYLAGKREYRGTFASALLPAQTAGLSNFSAPCTPPDGKLWVVRDLSFRANVPALTAFRLAGQLMMLGQTDNRIVQVSGNVDVSSTAAAPFLVQSSAGVLQPFIVMPGEILRPAIDRAEGAGNGQFALSLLVTELLA